MVDDYVAHAGVPEYEGELIEGFVLIRTMYDWPLLQVAAVYLNDGIAPTGIGRSIDVEYIAPFHMGLYLDWWGDFDLGSP